MNSLGLRKQHDDKEPLREYFRWIDNTWVDGSLSPSDEPSRGSCRYIPHCSLQEFFKDKDLSKTLQAVFSPEKPPRDIDLSYLRD